MSRLVPLLILLLAGCVATPWSKQHVRIGMTRAQVVNLLGKPDDTREFLPSDVEALTYIPAPPPTRRGQPPKEPGKPYSVVLSAGRVTWQGTDMDKKITVTPTAAHGFVPVGKSAR